MNFSVSAPGKIILHGEHSVVHGKRAIACAIGSRITVSVTHLPGNEENIIIFMPSLHDKKVVISIKEFKRYVASETSSTVLTGIEKFCKVLLKDDCSNFMTLAVSCLLFAYCQVFISENSVGHTSSFSLKIESDLPIGAGLGSSAAFNTAIASAFLIFSGKITIPESGLSFTPISDENNLNNINSLAFEMEKIVHKTPSGIDNSIATFGGAVSFQAGVLKRFENMPELDLLVVNTQIPRSTKTLVAGVNDFLTQFPSIVNPILESMHNVVIKAEEILQSIHKSPNDHNLINNLGKLMITNQCLLSAIGVSHSALDKICVIGAKYGYPAKLTGAGGGGCAIVLLKSFDKDEKILDSFKSDLIKEGFTCMKVILGGPGVLVKANTMGS